ncbi:MAG: bifunctional phosphopantothenoylcysteine decarboxylase/phosphopantothenate--cysteine ligase CoaBC [Sulfurospirillum sp.]|nr:MAG: bifunctional phosphopantothenoylcysteine decarboxylase/phosphopantothenate--cysteine ligase CoaBC [Sulfurospirillum sp.]
MLLKGKKIVVGVTGSIAIYKALELIRRYTKAGAEVRVIMSEGAKRFISPLTFEAITRKTVLHEATESWADDNNHIDIGKWADIYVIAPVTANTLNKLSNGIADNLITQTALAFTQKQILLAPAANTNMYQNNTTVASLKMLKILNFEEVVPQKKLLACGDEGTGAMADPEDIFHKTAQILLRDPYWVNRRVVVTGGGTKEKIDDVRYISNFSSGKMAGALSTALYYRGADVCLLETQKIAGLPSDLYVIDVEDSEELHEYLVDAIRVAKKGVMTKATLMDDSVPELIRKKPYLFMAAAVSDYVPKYPQSGKLKKEMLGDEWTLEMKKNTDILKSINKEGIFAVGFKAESDPETALMSAKKMLTEKALDAVCLNNISDNPFGSDENEITLITSSEEIVLPKADKLTLSLELLDRLSTLD